VAPRHVLRGCCAVGAIALASLSSCAPKAPRASDAPPADSGASSRAGSTPGASALGPAGTTRWVVLDAVEHDAPLFGEELNRVEAAARAAIDRTPGLRAVPKDAIARIVTLAGSGRSKEGGPVCASPPTYTELLDRSYPDALSARLVLDCIGEHCTAAVEVAAELELVVKVDTAHDVASWERAFDGLRLAPAPLGSIEPAPGTKDATGPWSVAQVLAFGDFARVPQRSQLSTADLAACGGSAAATLLLSVTAEGRAQQCERIDGDVEMPCACSAFARHDFGTAAGTRRLTLRLRRAAMSSSATARHEPPSRAPVFVATDTNEPPSRRAEHARALQGCVTAATRKGKLEASLVLAESGKVDAAELAQNDLLSESERACVVRALGELRFACPAATPARVHATIRVGP
jgi:hypothetical protein